MGLFRKKKPNPQVLLTPTSEWLESYKDKQKLLTCANDLNAYFDADEIAGKKMDRLSVGTVSLPSGSIIVCDPLVYLDGNRAPYYPNVPSGEYEVILAVVTPSDGDCARYAAARIRFTNAKAAYYTEALTGTEDLSAIKEPGDGFGFPVDSGLGCICDGQTRNTFVAFEKEWRRKAGKDANLYDDYFSELMAKSYKNFPLYQREGGDWLN